MTGFLDLGKSADMLVGCSEFRANELEEYSPEASLTDFVAKMKLSGADVTSQLQERSGLFDKQL